MKAGSIAGNHDISQGALAVNHGDPATRSYRFPDGRLPMDGQPVYITLTTQLTDGTSFAQTYLYDRINGGTSIVTPAPGSELNDPQVTFEWETSRTDIIRFKIKAGSLPRNHDFPNGVKSMPGAGDTRSFSFSDTILPICNARLFITLITSLENGASYEQYYLYNSCHGEGDDLDGDEIVDICDPIVDSHGDGMSDAWELANDLDANNFADRDLDLDGDGLTNLEEYTLGLKANEPDSDFDGIPDVMVVRCAGT
jgi:hypothetical protein